MATRLPLHGLVKHQMHAYNVSEDSENVLTLWTFDAAYPVADARITYEQGAIVAWIASHWRDITRSNITANLVKTWDFGVSPPVKRANQIVFPGVAGTLGGAGVPAGLATVVALRTQPVGSAIRNKNNGRIYHSGINAVSGDGVTSPTPAATLAAYNNLLGRLNHAAHAASGDWSVVSWFHGGHRHAPNPRVAPIATPIDHLIVSDIARYMLKRQARQHAYARGA